jgi:hypothetical protein
MHECPECGQACACDGEDTWFEDVVECTHCLGVEEEEDDGSGWEDGVLEDEEEGGSDA